MTTTLPKPYVGYRELLSFQAAELVYEVTERFCECFLEPGSRSSEEMIQNASFAVQSIAEGAKSSEVSVRNDLRLTQVARASLEQLRHRYKNYLKLEKLSEFPPHHPVLIRLKEHQPKTFHQFAAWAVEERARNTVEQGQAGGHVGNREFAHLSGSPCPLLSSACISANGALSLLNIACYYLDRQIQRLDVQSAR